MQEGSCAIDKSQMDISAKTQPDAEEKSKDSESAPPLTSSQVPCVTVHGEDAGATTARGTGVTLTKPYGLQFTEKMQAQPQPVGQV
eukprot:g50019.t1